MANIKLKNALGTETVYTDVKTLSVPNADDTNENISFTNAVGNINITDTSVVNVTDYATAQIVDANLTSANIAKDVTVLGILGTHQGGIIPEGNIALNSSASQQTGIDVTNYATASVAAMPVSPLDSTIIAGAAYEEATGDYAWKSTVQIPAGYHEAQTLEKNFSTIFPAPTTEGTAGEVLLGYELFNHEGKKITGTMPNNATAAVTLDETTTSYTVPSGYHTGEDTVSHTLGSQGDVSLNKSIVSNTATITASQTDTTGYIVGTTKSDSITVAASELVSGNRELTPSTSAQTDIDVTNYATVSVAAMPAGVMGTVSATKSAVSNNTITVTPQISDGTAGYNTMASKTGTAVTVSASELVSGSLLISTNTTTNVTNLASVVTNVPQAVPIDVSTDAGMTAVLTSENVGKCYRFTGTTGTYTNGDLYVVTA